MSIPATLDASGAYLAALAPVAASVATAHLRTWAPAWPNHDYVCLRHFDTSIHRTNFRYT